MATNKAADTEAKKRMLRDYYDKGDRENRDYVYGWDEGESKVVKYS